MNFNSIVKIIHYLKKSAFIPCILIIVGIFTSYKQRFSLWYIDTDMAAIPTFYLDFLKEGFSLLKYYFFPIDNWIFSILLPDSVLFYFFGCSPKVLLWSGIIFFWLTAFSLGLLVKYISNLHKATWAVALILSAPQIALGRGGYLTYPIAHQTSMFWSFLILLGYFIWINKKSYFSIFITTTLLLLLSFSDPWVLPVISLPLILSSICMILFEYKNKVLNKEKLKSWLGIIISLIISITLSKSKFFGLLNIKCEGSAFYTKIHFSFKSLWIFFLSLPYYFNIIPFFHSKSFAPYRGFDLLVETDMINIVPAFINNTFLFAVIFIIIVNFIKNTRDERKMLIGFFSLFSILGILAVTFIFKLMRDSFAPHYIVNVFYIIIMSVVFSSWRKMSSKRRFIIISFFSLWISSSILGNISVWSQDITPVRTKSIDILNQLQKYHIDYAYGDYWLLNTNTLNWLAHDQIHIASLTYNEDYHGFLSHMWNNPLSYTIPKGKRWALVLTGQENNCKPFPSCVDAAQNEFGQANSILNANGNLYLIYDVNKTDNFSIHVGDDIKSSIPINEEIFSMWDVLYPKYDTNIENLSTIEGWSSVQTYDQSITSISKDVFIRIPVRSAYNNRMRMRFLLSSDTHNALYPDVDVFYKEKYITTWHIGFDKNTYFLELPVDNDKKYIKLRLHINNSDSTKHSVRGIRLYEVHIIK